MKRTLPTIIAICTVFLATAQTKITLNTDLAKTQINKHIYGHFAKSVLSVILVWAVAKNTVQMAIIERSVLFTF